MITFDIIKYYYGNNKHTTHTPQINSIYLHNKNKKKNVLLYLYEN